MPKFQDQNFIIFEAISKMSFLQGQESRIPQQYWTPAAYPVLDTGGEATNW